MLPADQSFEAHDRTRLEQDDGFIEDAQLTVVTVVKGGAEFGLSWSRLTARVCMAVSKSSERLPPKA